MTGQNDRQDESLTDQVCDQAGHCPLTGRYFQPWYDSLVWLDLFDLWNLLKRQDCRSFSILKTLTGYRPYSQSVLFHAALIISSYLHFSLD